MANGGGYQRSGSGHPPAIRAFLAGRLRADPGGAPPLTRPRSPPSLPGPLLSPTRYITPATPHNKDPTSGGTFNTGIVVTLV